MEHVLEKEGWNEWDGRPRKVVEAVEIAAPLVDTLFVASRLSSMHRVANLYRLFPCCSISHTLTNVQSAALFSTRKGGGS